MSTKPNDPKMNAKRTEWARHALAAFAVETGMDLAEAREDVLCDLLCDLRHYAAANEIDYDAQDTRAQRHFYDELEPPDERPCGCPAHKCFCHEHLTGDEQPCR